MASAISDLILKLRPDPWRASQGFSSEVEEANRELFRPGITETQAEQVLSAWLQRHQPCLFGRIAAKLGAVSYCVLNDTDLHQSDEQIKQKIQTARLAWTHAGFEGGKARSSFSRFRHKLPTLCLEPKCANSHADWATCFSRKIS